MKFSTFLQKIYKVKNYKITKQEDFVQQLFKTCCPIFSYTDDYCKKILNGNKPLSDDLRELVSSNSDYKDIPLFFEEHINKKHFTDLLDEFEIDEDEKKDLSIFAEALTYQFANYIEYGEDNLPTSVKTIYEILVDQYGNGSIEDANEKALFSAYQQLFQAVTSLASIRVNEDILTLQAPFENFFSFIYKTYRSYEAKCNRQGKEIYVYVKDKILDGKLEIDDYLKKISEPGALPIELIKQIHFTIYDNYKFEDKDLSLSIRLFEKDEHKRILKTFKNFEFYPVNEIFFTQKISFSIEGKDNNLINDALNICNRTFSILTSIGMNLKQDEPYLIEINQQIDKAFRNLKSSTIQYVVDGTYYPDNGVIKYAPSIVPMYATKDGKLIESGSQSIEFSRHPVLKINEPFKTKFKLLVTYQNEVWKMNKHEGFMAELYTINRNNTFRLYLVPVTSKARLYRLIREVSKHVYVDDMVGFILTSIVVYNTFENDESKNNLIKMTSKGREKAGKDALVSYSYYDGKKYGLSLTKEDSILGKTPTNDIAFYNFLTPLISHIHFNDFYQKNKDRIEKELKEKKTK